MVFCFVELITLENTHVNIYNKPAYAAIGLGSIEFLAAIIALILNILEPFEKSNKGFFIGFAAVSDIVDVGLAYLLTVIFIVFGIAILRLGFYGLKADKPVLAIIGICEGSLGIFLQIVYIILITMQTIAMYKVY